MESTVVAVDPRIDSRWLQIAASEGSLFTSPPWIRAVCDTYGFTPQARLAFDVDGMARGGFVWAELDDIRGCRSVSMPFSDRAEPIVPDPATWSGLVADALQDTVPLTVRCLQEAAPDEDPRFARVGEAAWHGSVIDAPAEDLLRSVPPSVRRDVNVAHRRGIEIHAFDDFDAVRAFHGIHLLLRKRKFRLLAQPLEFFERIWEEFSATGGITTLLAYADGVPVAGAVLLEWRDTLYFKFAASLAEALHLRPNYAIYWRIIQEAAERGLRQIDWGLSDLDQPGLVAYKRKWAGSESRIVTLRTHAGETAMESPLLLKGLTDLLTDESVPDPITARAGSLLYRYFT